MIRTYADLIYRFDELKPNIFQFSQKVRWLSKLELQLKETVYDTHDNPPAHADEIPFAEDADFNSSEAHNKVLTLPDAYEDLYIHYLEAKIDYANNEYERYNNSNAMFLTMLNEFTNWYNRTHRPLSARNNYF